MHRKVYTPWASEEGIYNMAETLYYNKVDGTIITRTNICTSNQKMYQAFAIVTNTDDGIGKLDFVNHNETTYATYQMHMKNGLWFHKYNPQREKYTSKHHPYIKR